MFERTLESLIKGFRSHRGKDEAAYLATVLGEIRQEIRGGDMEVKAEGILKLIYLQMLGHMSSKAAFHIVEVMAATKYHLKYIGYLGAAQCLEPGTDVIILATNLIKKDLASRSDLDIMAALAGLSHLMTPELAQHFANEIIAMLNHSKPAIRKKAVVALHSILVHDPESLDKAWTRLQDRLEDSDQGVVSATVSILCELARKDPSPFLPLAPQLFQLLTSSTNNWVLIKVVKLFGALSTCEPRLSKRLLPPITSIIAQTPAMSLLYECIHTIIVGDMLSHAGGDQLAQTCVDKLSQFIADTDQNLKFIALVALIKILPSHPELVMPHRDAIADLLHDDDSSVRLRALTLLSGLATKENFSEYCLLLEKAIDGSGAADRQAPSAADALRGILAQSGPKGDNATTSPTRSYSVSAQRAFLREAAMCVAVVAAKDHYGRVSNLQEFLELLLRLYPTAARPFRLIAERVVIDLVRRHPEHADALMRVHRGHLTNRHLRLCALRASLSSHARGARSSHEVSFSSSSLEHVSLQVLLDSASRDKDAVHEASLRALGRRHTARNFENQQRFTEVAVLLRREQLRLGLIAGNEQAKEPLEQVLSTAALPMTAGWKVRGGGQKRGKGIFARPAYKPEGKTITSKSRVGSDKSLYHVAVSAIRETSALEQNNTDAGDEAADAVPVVMLDEDFNIPQDQSHLNVPGGGNIAPVAPDVSTAGVKKIVVKAGNRRGGRR